MGSIFLFENVQVEHIAGACKCDNRRGISKNKTAFWKMKMEVLQAADKN